MASRNTFYLDNGTLLLLTSACLWVAHTRRTDGRQRWCLCGRLCVCLCASKVNVVVTVLESFVVAVSQDEWMTVRMLVPYILVWYCE